MTPSDPPAAARHIKVLGVGNLLWADEGFGVRAVERLQPLVGLRQEQQLRAVR